MKLPEEAKGLYPFSNKKRVVDLALAAVLLGPAELATRVVTRKLKPALDEGPAILEQVRMGGVIIDKARTMHTKEPDGKEAQARSVWDSSNIADPRIPNDFARSVRYSRADEAPQVRQALLGAILGHGRRGSPRLSTAGGLRPLELGHDFEFYQRAKRTEPEAAEWWYEIGVPYAPKAVISPASVALMGRDSNEQLDAAHWIRLEYNYCVEGEPTDDFDLAGRAAAAVGAVMLSKAIDKARERVTDVNPLARWSRVDYRP